MGNIHAHTGDIQPYSEPIADFSQLPSRLQQVLSLLRRARPSGSEFTACCPAHDDKTPSLTIRLKEDRILLLCHGGCTTDRVVQAMGLSLADLFLKTHVSRSEYIYRSLNGARLYQAVVKRMEEGKKQVYMNAYADGQWMKTMTLPDGSSVERVPYCLPELVEACANGRIVFIPEGEKCVDILRSRGFVATTNPNGAGKWRNEYSAYLKGCYTAIILPDNDEPGEAHALTVKASLDRTGVRAVILRLPHLKFAGDDVEQYFQRGGSVQELKALVSQALTQAS